MVMLAPPAERPAVVDDPREAAAPAEALYVVSPGARLACAAPAERPEVPVVQASVRCPACGQSPAVVFPLLRGGASPDVPLVCLKCCPKAPGGRT